MHSENKPWILLPKGAFWEKPWILQINLEFSVHRIFLDHAETQDGTLRFGLKMLNLLRLLNVSCVSGMVPITFCPRSIVSPKAFKVFEAFLEARFRWPLSFLLFRTHIFFGRFFLTFSKTVLGALMIFLNFKEYNYSSTRLYTNIK